MNSFILRRVLDVSYSCRHRRLGGIVQLSDSADKVAGSSAVTPHHRPLWEAAMLSCQGNLAQSSSLGASQRRGRTTDNTARVIMASLRERKCSSFDHSQRGHYSAICTSPLLPSSKVPNRHQKDGALPTIATSTETHSRGRHLCCLADGLLYHGVLHVAQVQASVSTQKEGLALISCHSIDIYHLYPKIPSKIPYYLTLLPVTLPIYLPVCLNNR